MRDPYTLALKHLEAGLAEASENNIDAAVYGQALIWKVLEMYRGAGRSKKDIESELMFTVDNIDDDGIFHVSRN